MPHSCGPGLQPGLQADPDGLFRNNSSCGAMALESTQKVRAEARSHMKTSTFGRRAWILGVGIEIRVGKCWRHEPLQLLTGIDPDADSGPGACVQIKDSDFNK